MEEWKDVAGFEGLYMVSTYGRIKSMPKKTRNGSRILRPIVQSNGYCHVTLCVNNKTHQKRLHRIVAESFISNPSNLPHVNHKDLNKTNNSIDNLEWVTSAENMKHSYLNGRVSKRRKAVSLICEYGNIIEEFTSITEASIKTNCSQSSIRKCCIGLIEKTKNKIFKYTNLKSNN